MANVDVVFTSNLGEFKNALPQQIERALIAIGMMAESHAKEYCPVDTGRLRNSITHEVRLEEKAVIIGSNVAYAPFVELGHRQNVGQFVPVLGKRLVRAYIPPQPFLRPAIENHQAEYKSLAESALKS